MKKALATITLICYLAVSSGIVVNLHYCMGRVDSVKFFAKESNICGRCGMHNGKSHKCCGDEIKIIKLQDDQQSTQVLQSLKAPYVPIFEPSYFIEASICPLTDADFYHIDHSPPLLTGQDTYLQ
ncbi:MAG: hypothetical protein ABUT20_40515, partial [Bacteroidota bacterium]